jgi:hypothetical protein
MTDEAKNRIEALELLRKSAMERYAWRAQVEWKLCLALWTALAAFSGAVLTGKALLHPGRFVVVVVILLAAPLCWLHWKWLCGLRDAQRLDNRISFFFRDRIMAIAEEDFPPADEKSPTSIRQDIENLRAKDRDVWSHWSHGFQLLVTILLASGAVATVWWATYQPKQAADSGPNQAVAPSATDNAPKP